ncbi:hypothetical protein SSE37_19332 [Sagittula stellata E-37]|uniref:Uncharacterized protein n=2 Tax=Sagittula stellata TaxID=52603 RepID=A3JXF4_SAGS3|nr:hypothetical protein SSE37_19332 [Sagittula stellata E-37]
MPPPQGSHHHRPAEGARGGASQSIGHRAKAERLDGESQGQAASRLAHERNALRTGGGASAVVEAAFVSLSLSFSGVAVAGASGAAGPGPETTEADATVGAATAEPGVTTDAPEEAVTVAAPPPDAPSEGTDTEAASGYSAYMTSFSAQVSYTSTSIALQLLR